MSPVRSLKERINAGEIVTGLRIDLTFGRAELERQLALTTYDYLYIDGQHTAYTEPALVVFCNLAAEMGLPVKFRIPHTRDAFRVGRFLDLGLASIMVPEVENEQTVDEAINAFYYPQVGRRSWGGVERYGLAEQSGRQAYAAWWNANGVLAIQPESIIAISRVAALTKPGIDYVHFGPNDLLFSLEEHPHFPLRTLEECYRHVAAQLQGSNVRMGITLFEGPQAREHYQAMGFTVFQEDPRPYGHII